MKESAIARATTMLRAWVNNFSDISDDVGPLLLRDTQRFLAEERRQRSGLALRAALESHIAAFPHDNPEYGGSLTDWVFDWLVEQGLINKEGPHEEPPRAK